jgi:phosphate transport system substrate-binding protein
VSKAWRDKIGKGTQPAFPVGVGARGSSGVAAKLQSTPGGITYVDVAYSLKNHFTIAKVRNRAGKFLLPGLKQIQAAADSIRKLHNSQNAFTAVDPNPRAKNAYPICTFTWVIVPQKTSKAPELKKFITWALNTGQSYGPKLLFVPVPKAVKQAGLKTLAKVHS